MFIYISLRVSYSMTQIFTTLNLGYNPIGDTGKAYLNEFKENKELLIN